MNGGYPPVVLEHVTKRYEADVLALDDISLTVAPGEMLALLGPSGCGKSTLLNLIGCIDLPTSGSVRVAGQETRELRDDALTVLRRDGVGTIFQFFNLLPTMTLAQNIALPLILQRAPRKAIAARVGDVIAIVGLDDRAQAYPGAVSGGQMQRAAIARAIVHRPQIVLADEPTGNLDSRNGQRVLDLLRRLADGGQTIVMATHSEAAATMCDRQIHLLDGKIDGIVCAR